MKRASLKIPASSLFSLLFTMTLHGSSAWGADVTTIKFATIAPEGSTWMSIVHEYDSYVKEHTGGRTKFVWYAGGVMGDEPEMVTKIKQGKIDGGVLSGLGLGQLVPEVRVLELPLMFKSTDEVDYVLNKLDKTFRKLFEDKGYILLGWSEQGFIYAFTNKPIRKMEDFTGIKMWVWAGDTMAKVIFDSFGYFTPIPIPVPDVFSALQSGKIDAFYNTPLGVAALQWYTRAKYMLNVPIVFAIGAFIINKKTFDAFPPDVKLALIGGGREVFPKITASVRKDNAVLLASLPSKGVEIVTPEPDFKEKLRVKISPVYGKLSKQFYPDWLFTGVWQSISEYRRTH